MRRRMSLVFVTVALVAAGCSGGDGSSASTPPAPTSAPTSAPSTGPPTTVSPTTVSPTSGPTTTAGSGQTSTTTAATTPATGVALEDLVLDLEVVADGFDQPVFVTAPPGDDRLFVVDQPGRIWVVGDGDPEVFLDISDRVVFGGEQGLLGLAFPPDHAGSGVFYVDYVGSGPDGDETRISAFDVDGDGGADPDSERILLTVTQPARNHNGGMIAFGPDGNLWIGMGDGGGSDDGFGNGQEPRTTLGAMLRITPTADGYEIPAGNPYTAGDGAPEVWAIGLRNPWRFSFDGDALWIGDVGQNALEEIDLLDATGDAGANLGWPRFEASQCYLSDDCDDTGLTMPVLEYPHSEGCSVTGGYVYRGTAIPELTGHYFYGDYCSGWIRSAVDGAAPFEWFPEGTVGGLSSFGVDDSGELYVTGTEGTVSRVVRG